MVYYKIDKYMKLEEITRRIFSGEYEISFHADKERRAEEIEINDIKEAIKNGEILEDYPNDPRGPSCLVLGYARDGRAMHIVCALLPTDMIRIITVYIPSLPKWIDPRTRRKKEGE